MIDGLLVVDKPAGPTSHDVVMAIRRAAGQRKVGHAGTLDPAATGVLVLLLGRLTRLADLFTGQPKRYRAVVELGAATTTGDGEGEVTERADVPPLDDAPVAVAVTALEGTRAQIPPAFSARKVDGRPLYERARAGEAIPHVESKTVTVHNAQLVEFESPRIVVDMEVSKGTYVRVLAEELGRALGLPAHLAGLTRTASGPFVLDDAHPLEALEAGGSQAVEGALLDPATHPLGLRRGRVDRTVGLQAAHGRWVAVRQVAWFDDAVGERGPDALLIDESGILGWYRQEGPVLKPRAVLRAAGGSR